MIIGEGVRERENGRIGEWENGRMGEWENRRIAREDEGFWLGMIGLDDWDHLRKYDVRGLIMVLGTFC